MPGCYGDNSLINHNADALHATKLPRKILGLSLYISPVFTSQFYSLPELAKSTQWARGTTWRHRRTSHDRASHKGQTGRAGATETRFLATMRRLDGKTQTHREFPEKKGERPTLLSLPRTSLGKPTEIRLVRSHLLLSCGLRLGRRPWSGCRRRLHISPMQG